jgi:hypothetical protein
MPDSVKFLDAKWSKTAEYKELKLREVPKIEKKLMNKNDLIITNNIKSNYDCKNMYTL